MVRPLVSAVLLLAPCALAVSQPDGTIIPASAVEGRLSSLLNGSPENDNINEGLSPQADARVQPETFSPLCGFTGKYVAKGGGANFALGWYNVEDTRPSAMPPRYVPVDTGANLNTAAASSEVFILFNFSSSLPPSGMRELTAVSILNHPRYRQGRIGFVLVPNPNGTGNANATQYHYTEHRYNVQCTTCAVPGPWYSSLTFNSKQLPNTIYLGFEDLDFRDQPGSSGVNGNDLDYEDFLFRITGVRCPSAGQFCELGTAQGVCRRGITDCDANGQGFCKPLTSPNTRSETCDGEDEDCDGLIDEGASCAAGKTCDRGRCVDACSPGNPCGGSRVCVAGRCVEPGCESVTCADGASCHQGTCSDPCVGVVCPAARSCRAGRCVDPCDGVTCGADQVCDRGVCVVSCSCSTCGAQNTCGSSGLCVAAACGSMTCGVSQACDAGVCMDRCAGATCPIGETCTSGECVALPPPPCDDQNACTTDSRDPVLGCVAAPVMDGLACTTSACTGQCMAGACTCGSSEDAGMTSDAGMTGGGGGATGGGGGATGGGGGATGGGGGATGGGGGTTGGGGGTTGGGGGAMSGGGSGTSGGGAPEGGGGGASGSGCGCTSSSGLSTLVLLASVLLNRKRRVAR